MTKSKTLFNLVLVKSKSEQKYFVGKIPIYMKLKGLAVLRNLLEFKGRNGECPYKKLTEYVKDKCGEDLDGMSVNVFPAGYLVDAANEMIYSTQKKLVEKYGEDCILNDVVINPEKYQCECGQMVHTQFKNKHDSEYCVIRKINIEDLLIDLV